MGHSVIRAVTEMRETQTCRVFAVPWQAIHTCTAPCCADLAMAHSVMLNPALRPTPFCCRISTNRRYNAIPRPSSQKEILHCRLQHRKTNWPNLTPDRRGSRGLLSRWMHD